MDKTIVDFYLRVRLELNRVGRPGYAPSYDDYLNTVIKEFAAGDRSIAEAINVKEVESWLESYSADDEWKNERPPLALYAKVITVCLFNVNVGAGYRLNFLEILNYYGNFPYAVDLAEGIKEKELDTENYFKLKKYLGKAYKSLGYYDKTRLEYEAALEKAWEIRNKAYIAYFLMLYAKLCNDYDQKKGFYVYFHEKSYAIFTKLIERAGRKKRDNYKRMWEICTDSYAKAIYRSDPEKGEKLHGEVIESHGDIIDDVYVRINSNRCLNKIRLLIANYNGNFDEIVANLNRFEGVIEKSHGIQNDIAYSTRTTQLLKLYRDFLEKLQADGTQDEARKLRNIIGPMEIDAVINQCEYLSTLYNTRKNLAFILFEKVKWKYILAEEIGLTETDYTEMVDCLVRIVGILKSNNQNVLSDIYIDVLIELGKIQLKLKNWEEAANCYKTLFSYFKDLLAGIRSDEDEIKEVVKNSRHREKLKPEFRLLQSAEAKDIHNLEHYLAIDYKILLEKTLEISEKLSSVQFEENINLVKKTILIARHFNYHNLAKHINEISIKVKKRSDYQEIADYLDDFYKKLTDSSKNIQDIFKSDKIDLYEEIAKIRDDLYFKSFNIEVVPADQKIIISFNSHVFRAILAGLLYNVKEEADLQKRSDFKILISLEKKSVNKKKECIYLVIRDNVGHCDHFADVINCINNNKEIISGKRQGSGTGLGSIKDITNFGVKWELVVHNQREKSLKIPISLGSKEEG